MSEPSGNDRALDVDTRPVEGGSVESGTQARPPVSQAEAAAPAGHAGAILARARQAQGMSVEQIGQRIKVGARQVEAIEAGRWGDFPTPAILRGFVRAYAKAVEIDAAPLLAELPRIEVTPGQLTGVASVGRPVSAGGRNFSGFGWWIGAGAGALLLIGAAVLLPKLDLAGWIAAREHAAEPRPVAPVADVDPASTAGAPTVGATAPAASAQPLPSGEAAGAAMPPVEGNQSAPVTQPVAPTPAAPTGATGQLAAPVPLLPTQPVPTQAGATSAGAPRSASTAAGTPATAAAPATAPAQAASVGAAPAASQPAAPAPAPVQTQPAPGNSRLKLDFERETWIEIRDASGKIISTGVTPAGGSVTSEGKPPFRIIIGNVPGTRFAVDGRAVELAPFSSGNVARFTYPPENKQ